MRAFLACTAALLLLVVGPRAQERPRTDQTRDEQLGAYLRMGRYADARRVIDQMLRAQRQEDLENLRAVFDGPNMSIRRGSASFSCDVDASGVRVPLTINGSAANWLLDTGANISVISDAEAARLGLGVRESAGRVADLAGGTIPARTAVAHRVVIGHTLLREVSVLVSPADREVVTIPDLRLRVGGKDLALTRGSVFSRPVGDDRFHGLLGMDALSQATEVRIDFRSMTLTLQ